MVRAPLLLAPLLLLLVQGCHRVTRAPMKERISMSDLLTETQLGGGFYNLEANSWRWTAQHFSVVFPGPVSQQDEVLTLQFFIPDNQIQKLARITLNAEVNGTLLKPETYSKAGSYTFRRLVAATALRSNLIPVLFSLDKATDGGGTETRELGIVVTDIALQTN